MKEFILQCLHDNSGGIKFMDLLVQVLSWCHENDQPTLFPEELLKTIKEMGLGILEYGWDMGGIVRMKQFIYTPVG